MTDQEMREKLINEIEGLNQKWLEEENNKTWGEFLLEFIIADRKRIVQPLVKEDMSKYDNAPFDAIRKVLINAGLNTSQGKG